MHAFVAGQMRVQIDEPGQQRGFAEIDHPRAGRNAHARSHFRDALAFDANHGRPNGRGARAVDESCSPHERDLRTRRLGGEPHRQ